MNAWEIEISRLDGDGDWYYCTCDMQVGAGKEKDMSHALVPTAEE